MRTLFIILAWLQCSQLSSQQIIPTRLLWDNMAALNPAAKPLPMLAHGNRGYIDAGFKTIFWGDDSPRIVSLMAGWAVDPKNTLALNIRSEKAGIWSQTEASFNYSYALQSTKAHFLALGLSVGANQSVSDPAQAQVRDLGDFIAGISDKNLVVDVGAGIYYAKKAKGAAMPWSAGLSVQNITVKAANIRDNQLSVKLVPHFFGVFGAQKDISKNTYLEGILAFRYVNNAPLYAELIARAHFWRKFWLGTGLTTSKSLVMDMGFKNPRLQIGLSCELWLAATSGLPLVPELRALLPFCEAKK